MRSSMVTGFGEYNIPALNTMASPEQKLSYLTQQIYAISVAARQAKARGDTADLQALIGLLRKCSLDANSLRLEVSRAQSPAGFMVALSTFSDGALKVAGQIGQSAVDAISGILSGIGSGAKGAGKSIEVLPLVLIGLVAVIGVGLYKGSLQAKVAAPIPI